MKRIASWAACFWLTMVASAHAEMTTSAFLTAYQGADTSQRETLQNVLLQNYNGMAWANVAAMEKKTCIFKDPAKMVLVGAQLVDILRREAVAHPVGLADKPYGMGLLFALTLEFPCPDTIPLSN